MPETALATALITTVSTLRASRAFAGRETRAVPRAEAP